MHISAPPIKSITTQILSYFFITVGAFLAAFALDVFFTPNRLIDGGVVGIAMIMAKIFGNQYLPYFVLGLNLPFAYLALRSIGKGFVIHMLYALIAFAFCLFFINQYLHWQFIGESIEYVVIGGCILGIGIGLIIRYGGCLDGTEILGIIANRRTGTTVGQVVLICNILVFGMAGIVFHDWHPALLSMITYMVVIRVMDAVIVGMDETKSVLIISMKSKAIADAIIHELGLGLTIMYGRGGFSGDEREIIYVIAERLQLAELKELIHREDPSAFIAIENLHEVSNGKQGSNNLQKKTRVEQLITQILKVGKK